MKSFLPKFALVLFSILLVVLTFEAGLRLTSPFKSAEDLRQGSLTKYLDEFFSLKERNCILRDMFYPHPFLQYVHGKGFKCSIGIVNSDGFTSQEFPKSNHPETFDILIMGASVAQAFAQGEITPTLESYVSADGKPIKVYTTATGTWHQPQQLISYLMYRDRFDAFLTIEGYNEIKWIEYKSFYAPSMFYYTFTKPEDLHVGPQLWIAEKLNSLNTQTFLSRSFLFTRLSTAYKIHAQDVLESAISKTWSEKKFAGHSYEENLNQYFKTLRDLTVLTKGHGQKLAIFIQPVVGLGKVLTSEEKKMVDKETFYLRYKAFAERALSDKKLPAHSLIDIFEKESQQIYSDSVHFKLVNYTQGPGNSIMGSEVLKVLRRDWGIKKR